MRQEECIFCRILAGRAPGSIVYQDGEVAVIMSLHQFNPGHALVVPRRHVETIYDLPEALAGPLFATAARVARAVKTEFAADGVTVRQHNELAGGQTVPHLHIHVVPRHFGDHERHFPGAPSDSKTLDALAARLRARLAAQGATCA